MTSYQFVKVMDRNFSETTNIPVNLVKHFIKEAEVLTLEGPSGNRWLVTLSMLAGHLCLKEGWKEFVEAHNVEEGDFLVFEYCGSSRFSVLAFDQSGCEREGSYFVKIKDPVLSKGCQTQQVNHKLQLNDAFELNPRFTCDDNPTLKVISDDETSFRAKSNCGRSGPRLSRPNDKIKYEHIIQSKRVEKHSGKRTSVNLHPKKTGRVEMEQMLKYLNLTNAIRAETPYFTKLLMHSHLPGTGSFMTLPRDFAVKHLHLKPQTIQLHHRHKMWSVEYKARSISGCLITGFNGKGWRQFVLDNDLVVGDECIFVLSRSQKKKQVMDVYIVHACGT